MNKRMNWITGPLVVALTLSSIGCGQSFRSTGSGAMSTGSQATNADVSDQLAKANQAAKDAQVAMADAQAAIASISDANGNINVGLFTKSTAQTTTQGLLAPLIAKLQPVFDCVYNKALVVKQQFDSARASLAAALAKLNPGDATQASQIAQINAQMAQIDTMEQQFANSMHLLAGKLDLATTALDKIISGATSFIPGFGWLAGMAIDMLVMSDVKNLISDFKMKLLSL
jgi:hypothetical protein